MISGHLHLENWKISYGPYLGPFWVLTLFGTQKLRGLITFEAKFHFVWNFAGFSLVMISKRWYGPTYLILPLNGPMGMGQFGVPKSAVGHKWSYFQPFGFKFGLCTWFLGISTWKTQKLHIGHIWATFGVPTLFRGTKVRCLITFEAVVHFIWNLAGFSLVMISKSR